MARNSAYGNILSSMKMPDWVFGGEYGDISNMLNQRDNAFEVLQQNELQNEQRQIVLDKQRRMNEYEKSVPNMPSDPTDPLSLGEMYRLQIAQANKTGNPDVASEIQVKLAELEKQQEKQKIADFTNAANMADTISPEVLGQIYPNFPTSEARKIYNSRRQKGTEREGPSTTAIDPRTGRKSRISWSDAAAAQDAGLVIDPSPAQIDDILMKLRSMQDSKPTSSKPAWYIPFSPEGERLPPAAGKMRPSPGDEVEQIKLKRKVQ